MDDAVSGCNVCLHNICAALRFEGPRLFWLSVSAISSLEEFLSQYSILHETAAALGIPVVVGGRALGDEVRREMQYTAHCDTLRHLVSFVKTLERPAGKEPEGHHRSFIEDGPKA